MAPAKDAAYSDRAVEDAIARVLDAERRARTEVATFQEQAEAIRADARMRDKRIAERAAARIAAIRAGMAEKRAARLAALEATRNRRGAARGPGGGLGRPFSFDAGQPRQP